MKGEILNDIPWKLITLSLPLPSVVLCLKANLIGGPGPCFWLRIMTLIKISIQYYMFHKVDFTLFLTTVQSCSWN